LEWLRRFWSGRADFGVAAQIVGVAAQIVGVAVPRPYINTYRTEYEL
jgi:hypothetical protein